MILAIDVGYGKGDAYAVGVFFNWDDEHYQKVIDARIFEVQDYIPGEFYKRELPCIIQLLKQVEIANFDAILIDGHVQLDEGKLGLGGHLNEFLESKIPIIGVAKRPYFGNQEYVKEVLRGGSKNPLYVSTVNFDLDFVAENVKKMHGAHRIPSVLKQLDQITKGTL